MKIMYIANGNGLSDKISGSLTRTINIAKRLQKKGHTIHFLTTIGGFRVCKMEKLNALYHILPASIWRKEERGLLDRLLSYFITTLAFLSVVSGIPDVDVIYTDSDYFCDTIPAILCKKKFRSVKWVAMTHHKISVGTGTKLRDFVINLFSAFIQEFSYFLFKNYADKVFVLKTSMGRSIARHLISKGVSSHKIEYVLNGVELDLAKSTLAREKIYDACFLGGLRPTKGLYDIVPIWKNVCKAKKDAVLLLMGNIAPIYLKELKLQIRKNGLTENIKFTDYVTSEKKMEYLKSSKIFIFPSHEEGFGIAVLEAMASGLPVIAWELAVYREIFVKGMLQVPEGAIKRFAVVTLKLLEDEKLRERISEDATKIASNYDWDLLVKRELSLLERLIEG